MRKIATMVSVCLMMGMAHGVWAGSFGAKTCGQDPRLKCVQAGRGHEWSAISGNKKLRDLVGRLNRVDSGLGGTIAVPRNLQNTDMLAVAPLPAQMPAPKQKLLIIDLGKLAWGAYDPSGALLRWGPIAPGKDYCPDIGKGCRTATGNFAIYDKQGAGCISHKFPRPNGGAKMPYCSFFHTGQALHAGSLPGGPDSHGCVHTLREDAKWLSQQFLEIGTPVYVRA